jgi:hypothetical protein
LCEELLREYKLRVKVFNSFVEKRVEIDVGARNQAANSMRNALCTMFVQKRPNIAMKFSVARNLTNHLKFDRDARRENFFVAIDQETKIFGGRRWAKKRWGVLANTSAEVYRA